MCVLSSVVVCGVPFSATRCKSNRSKHGSDGRNNPEMVLEWTLEGLGKGL